MGTPNFKILVSGRLLEVVSRLKVNGALSEIPQFQSIVFHMKKRRVPMVSRVYGNLITNVMM